MKNQENDKFYAFAGLVDGQIDANLGYSDKKVITQYEDWRYLALFRAYK